MKTLFKNIFLVNEFYGSLADKFLQKEISKTHTKRYKNVLLLSFFSVLRRLPAYTKQLNKL